MGQAKRRGTFEQRKQAAIERDAAIAAKKAAERQARQAREKLERESGVIKPRTYHTVGSI